MTDFKVQLEVYPKPGMPDPQSSDELRKINALFPKAGVTELRVSKSIGFVVSAATTEEASEIANSLADNLLVQPVLEDFEIRSISE